MNADEFMQRQFRVAANQDARLSQISLTYEAALRHPQGEPIAYVLAAAREDAIVAMQGLTLVDPEDAAEIRRLQNEVSRCSDLASWVAGAIERGRDLWDRLPPEAREDISSLGAHPQEDA